VEAASGGLAALEVASPEVALQLLQANLQRLPDRIRDEKLARELYCALAGNRWSKDGEVVALSWKRAANLVNALRRGALPKWM
jgi:hypothetical protein